MMIGIVLVHGMFHGPWCWDKVVPLLQADDVAIATPDLSPGCPDPSAAQAAVDRLAADGPVVACGHSFGGQAVTALDPANITRMVMLAAFLPDEREWFVGTPATEKFLEMVATGSAGTMVPRPDRAGEVFYADCSDSDAAWAIGNLCPGSATGIHHVVNRPAWRHVPTIYVQCSLDNVLTQEYMMAAAARVGRGMCMPTSHSPMISRPDLVADLLNSVVAELRT
jgi:pimeloyl-ACP methyl ester carboxylesterase